MSKLFIQIFVWKRLDDKRAVRFTCLEDISKHLFIVQSADFFSVPVKPSLIAYFDNNFVDLFIGLDPENRQKWSSSLEEAVALHEDEFRTHVALR
jgi:hypothetical protein